MNFSARTGSLPNPLEARQQSVSKVIDRVLVYDEEIVAVVLHGNFAIVLGENRTAPAMIADAVSEVLASEGITPSLDSSKCGSERVFRRLWKSFGEDEN